MEGKKLYAIRTGGEEDLGWDKFILFSLPFLMYDFKGTVSQDFLLQAFFNKLLFLVSLELLLKKYNCCIIFVRYLNLNPIPRCLHH